MRKPCTTCIVNQMCENECEEFVSYLKKRFIHQFGDDVDYVRIAYMIRNKAIKLIKNDTKMEWNWGK